MLKEMPTNFADTIKKAFPEFLNWLAPPWPLSWHLGALAGSVALPALFLGAYLLNQQHRSELDLIERDAMARAQAMSHATDAVIIGYVSTLRAIGANPALASGDLANFVDQARVSFEDTGIIVTLRDNQLNVLSTSAVSGGSLELETADAEFAREAITSAGWKVSNYSVAPGTSAPVVNIWVPAGVRRRTQLVLEAMIPASVFNATLLRSQIPAGWDAGLSDRRNRIIARTTDYEKFSGQLISEDTRRNTIGPAGIMRSIDLIGRPTMQAYLHSDLTGWRMSTWAPRSLIEARARESWTNFMLMGGSLAAFAALSAWLWASRMTATVTELAESAQRLTSGRLLDVVDTPVLEVNKLRDTISVAAAELIRRKVALAENAERLRLALVAGDMSIWEWEPDTDTTHWDDAMFRMTGFSPGLSPPSGRNYIKQIHADDVDRVQAAIETASEIDGQLHVDFRFLRPDGVVRWFAVRGSHFGNPTGKHRRFIGVHFDITDEMDAVARTHALLLEVSHRSKNLLAVILAISRLTARDAASVQAYERALSFRIGALAATQDLIVASDWQGVDLKALVLGQLNTVVQERVARVEISGPEITLNPVVAQNLGMAIAELALNALEHGALSNDVGKVAFTWDQSSIERSVEICFKWVERDGPPVAQRQKRGYGLAVTERLIAQSLKAKADIQFGTEGMQWSFSVPLSGISTDVCEPVRSDTSENTPRRNVGDI